MPYSTPAAAAAAAAKLSGDMNGQATVAPMSFLTEAQRAALDAALAVKQTEKDQAAKLAKAQHQQQKPKDGGAGDRKPRNIKGTGAPKKGGAGGKFTWGKLADEDAVASLDKHDPNYDSDEESNVVYLAQQTQFTAGIQAYKQEVLKAVEEYFSSTDMGNTMASLEELDAGEYSYYVVKILIRTALDRKSRECEMASVLLSSLYGEHIDPESMQKGFMAVVDAMDDLVLDVPDAPEQVALFIARAVVDDVLPPNFVGRVPSVEGSACAELKHKVQLHLSAPHGAERMQRCWGPGAGLSYRDIKESIAKMLSEFVASYDGEELRRVLHSLNVPFFHHEVVKQAIHTAIEHPQHTDELVAILAKLAQSGEISQQQVEKGFQRVTDSLADFSLDNPNAPEALSNVAAAATAAKLLPEDFPIARDSSVCSTASNMNGHSNVHAFKLAVVATVREYFDSCDASEVAVRLRDLEQPGLHHIFVKHAVQLAMDRKDRERELISGLLSELSPDTVSSDQLGMGFTRLLAALEDMVLDIPDAVHLLSLFLGRAIVDEILPPSFLASVLPSLRDNSLGVTVVKNTGLLLSARHAAERMQSCWHGGSLTVEQLKEQIKTLVKEYTVARDAVEAGKCLRDLAVPYYHHEAVKAALEAALEQPAAAGACMELMHRLADSGEVNESQMRKGFERIQSRLDDLVLDYPAARAQFAAFVEQATKEGWLTGFTGATHNGTPAAAPAENGSAH